MIDNNTRLSYTSDLQSHDINYIITVVYLVSIRLDNLIRDTVWDAVDGTMRKNFLP